MRSSAWCSALLLFAVLSIVQPHRIVGGSPAKIEDYPSIVQVERQNTGTGVWSQSCAASILTARSVLSAAHCFHGPTFEPRLRRIRAGTTYRNTGGEIAYIEYSFNHPSYTIAARYDGDICVVRLMTPMVYSNVIQRTAIPPQDATIPDNLPVVHAGWGTTQQGGNASEILLDVQIYTVNNEFCRERYASLPNNPVVTENMICAGLLNVGGADACQGDSGGPLYYGNITIGVVSWGHGCANASFPGISTAVPSYTQWIVDHVL
nr:trypsin, alkaline C-like [Maniola hyperantus]